MKKYVYSKSEAFNAPSYIKPVGKYINKVIDGAYKIEFKSNMCIVYMRMYYQIPSRYQDQGADMSLKEMRFIINITSYANKLRINLTEDTEYEKTIGQLILAEDDLKDLNTIKYKVMKMIRKSIAKEYEGYEFIY